MGRDRLPWAWTSDVPALTLMCQQLDLHAALQAEILEHGLTYETRGRRYANPAVAAASEVGRQLWSMMAQFGLSPADRSKLGVAEVKAMSKFDELLARRAQRDAPVQNGPSTLQHI